MGVDIHLLTEVRKNNVWQPVEEIPECYNSRNYRLFSFLNNFGTRGIPDELKNKKFRLETYESESYWAFDFTSNDLYGHSWVTLDELNEEIKKINKVFVSEEFLNIFFELGGVLPKGLTLNPDGDGIYVEEEDESEQYAIESIIEGANQLKEIAQKYQVNDTEIRLVFAYDC